MASLPECSPDGYFPLRVDREYEERLLNLCASESLEPSRWAALGPRFFMAGLAVMLASVPELDRRAQLALAEQLHPGASESEVFARWLERSPVRPSRFLPLLAMEMKHVVWLQHPAGVYCPAPEIIPPRKELRAKK